MSATLLAVNRLVWDLRLVALCIGVVGWFGGLSIVWDMILIACVGLGFGVV